VVLVRSRIDKTAAPDKSKALCYIALGSAFARHLTTRPRLGNSPESFTSWHLTRNKGAPDLEALSKNYS
jgi:hypothetical protein